MAVTEKEISDLINQLSTRPLEETPWQWSQNSIESLPTVSISGGTLDPTYGAVPNVTIGGGHVSAIGGIWDNGGTSSSMSSVGTPIWTTTTTTGTGYNWNTTVSPTTISAGGKMSLQGENADIEINGKSMKAWMEKVEERLNMLTPNPEMEKEWDDLRRLGERYRRLEKKCQEKSLMWDKLKAMPKPVVK